MDAVRRVTGRRAALSKLLELNGAGRKAGAGCDAPRWWSEGRLAQLEAYCEQDTRALSELVMRAEMRLPGMATTREASVLAQVVCDVRDAARDSETHRTQQRERQREESGAAAQRHVQRKQPAQRTPANRKRGRGAGEDAGEESGARGSEACTAEREHTGAEDEDAQSDAPATRRQRAGGPATQDVGGDARDGGVGADGGAGDADAPADAADAEAPRDDEAAISAGEGNPNSGGEPPKRAKRGRNTVQTYDETRRRAPRRPKDACVYLEKGNGRGAKRAAIVLGPAAVDRIVGGRYEWRDAGYKRPRSAR